MSLRGTHEVKENYQIVRLNGLLDAFSEPTVRKVLSNLIDRTPVHMILDLSKIEFIDSSGLGALVQIAKKLKDAGLNLQIITNTRVTQTVKLVRLETFLPLQNSLDDALKNINQA